MPNLRTLTRTLTLAIAELAFIGLMVSFIWQTVDAKAGTPPDLSTVQVSAAGALAVALGGGYAALLGVPTQGSTFTIGSVGTLLKERTFVVLGVLAYMFAGFATCATYALNEGETPSVLKTIAVAFGGYVIAFVGATMREV